MGDFTSKSAYKLFREGYDSASYGPWKCIWRLKVPQWMKFFAWLVQLGKPRTNVECCEQPFTQDPICAVCK